MISTPELHALGYDDNAIRRLVACGALHRIARGVYSVGSATLTFRARCRVALHIAGPDAAITGMAALHLMRVITWEPDVILVVSSRRCTTSKVTGVRHIHSRLMNSSDVRTRAGIRTARFARAVIDVADHRTADQLTKLLREARYRRVLDLAHLRAMVERCKHTGNSSKLRAAIAHLERGSNGSFSLGESVLWDLLHDVVPDETPLQNPDIHLDGQPTLPDLAWLRSLVIVEYDGAPHNHRDVQIDDRIRERRYRRERFLIIRVTPGDLAEHSAAIRNDVLNAILHQRQSIQAGLITPRPLAHYARRSERCRATVG